MWGRIFYSATDQDQTKIDPTFKMVYGVLCFKLLPAFSNSRTINDHNKQTRTINKHKFRTDWLSWNQNKYFVWSACLVASVGSSMGFRSRRSEFKPRKGYFNRGKRHLQYVEEFSDVHRGVAVPPTWHRMNTSAVGRENPASCVCTDGVTASVARYE